MKIRKALFTLMLLHMSLGFAHSFKIEYWLTSNGMQVAFYQAMEVPILDIRLAFRAGSAYDGPLFGLSALTTQMLNEGSKGLSSAIIAEKLEQTGAQFSARNDRDRVILNLRTLTDKNKMEQATSTFAQIISHPDFPEEALQREKNQQLMAIEQVNDSSTAIATQTFMQQLYQNHPYGHPVNGEATTVRDLTLDQVVHFYHQYFVSKNGVMVIVGAIDSNQAHQLAEQLTSDLPIGEAASVVARANPLAEEKNIAVRFNASQTMLRIGQLGITPQDPRYIPLLVGNYILGGASSISRLSNEIREKRGLTYGVGSQFYPLSGMGPFIVSFSTESNQSKKALHLVENILTEFVKNGPTTEEIIDAKRYLIGGFPLSLSSNEDLATHLLEILFYHLPIDYLDTYVHQVDAVTQQDIQKAFREVIDLKRLLEVSVGPL